MDKADIIAFSIDLMLAKYIAGWMTCFVDRDPTPEGLRNYFSEDLQESEEDE